MIDRSTFFIFFLVFSFPLIYSQQRSSIDWGDGAFVEHLLDSVSEESYIDTMTLSLDEAVNFAIRQNRTLQNASLEIRKAQAQRWKSIASMLPQANVGVTYIDMFGFTTTFAGNTFTLPNNVSHSVGVTMGLNGQSVITALLYKTTLQMQEINREISENTITENVTNAYMSVLITKKILLLHDSFIANVSKLYEQTSKMVEVGTLEKAQADLIKINLNKLKNANANVKRSLQLTTNTLKTLLVIDATSHIELTDSVDIFFTPENILGQLLSPFDINRNTTYRLQEQNTKMAKKNIHWAAWEYGPTLTLQYNYSKLKNFGPNPINMNPTNQLNLNVSFPLWTSGKTFASIKEKTIAYEQQENTFNETKDNLQIQYKQLKYNLVNAYETYKTENDNIEAVSSVLKDVTNKQKWGVASMQDLITATNDLIEVQQTYLNSMLTLIQNKTALDIFLNNK